MRTIVALITFGCLVSGLPAFADDAFAPATLPAAKQTIAHKYLSAKEAYAMKTGNPDKVLFVDVRTPAETEYVGIADTVDVNIPYMQDDYSAWDDAKKRFMMSPNSGFMMKVDDALRARRLARPDPIILMCRSGDRSAAAANLLTKAGFTNVFSVYEGFEGDMGKDGAAKGRRSVNGWKNAGLPWGYKLDKSRAYVSDN
jgi:rhodanese-related sulfurtransferase